MRNFIKKFVCATVSTAVALSISGSAFAQTVNMDLYYDGANHKYSAEEVKIVVKGEKITGLDVPPLIIGERTMVPARAVFEKLGCEIAWNEDAQEVYVMHGNDIITLKIDSKTGSKNGTDFTMDTPAKIVNDRTLIPIRAVSEAIDYNVGWDDKTRTVTIDEKKNEPTEKPSKDNSSDNNSSNNSSNSGNTSDNNNSNNNSSNNAVTPEPELISVTDVTVPESLTSEQKFYIKASGEISKYNSFILENDRLVVDVENAKNNVANNNITTTNSSVVSAVRSGQPESNVARVVFDLKSLPKYEVKLSSDKKTIEVSFTVTTVSNVSTSTKGTTDYVNIYGNADINVEMYMLADPDRVVIEVQNAVSSLKSNYTAEGTNYINGIRTTQYDSKTVQIVADVSRTVEATITKNNGYTSVAITKSSLDNLSYDSSSHTLTLLNTSGITDRGVQETDNYRGGTYRLTLNGDYSEHFGTGTIKCGDDYIDNIKVGLDSNGHTYFEAAEKRIVAVKKTDNSGTMSFKFVNPKEVYSKVVVIDAGHGKQDNGASGNGLYEKNVALAVVQKLYSRLEADPNIKVYATRLDDSYPTNASRARMGNQAADLFVSIHLNSSTSATPKGTEVLYNTHSNETGAGNKLTSKTAAQIALTWVINALGTENRGIKSRPDLIVLNQTNIPAILIETAFISNPSDAALMGNDATLDKLADNLYSAISIMLNDYTIR